MREKNHIEIVSVTRVPLTSHCIGTDEADVANIATELTTVAANLKPIASRATIAESVVRIIRFISSKFLQTV